MLQSQKTENSANFSYLGENEFSGGGLGGGVGVGVGHVGGKKVSKEKPDVKNRRPEAKETKTKQVLRLRRDSRSTSDVFYPSRPIPFPGIREFKNKFLFSKRGAVTIVILLFCLKFQLSRIQTKFKLFGF